MKYQALFSLKDKSKKIKMSSAAFLFGALRVKVYEYTFSAFLSLLQLAELLLVA